MQDEINEKVIALSIRTTKLTAEMLQKSIRFMLSQIKKQLDKPVQHHGKQTLKQLMKQNAGVSSIEITDSNIKAFESTAKKYGIDFALKKDATESPPRYLVFFKGRDADVLTAAFQEFSAKKLTQEQKPSIRKALAAFKDKAKQLMQTFMSNVIGTEWEMPVVLAGMYGLRMSEIIGLRTTNIDLEKMQFGVVEQMPFKVPPGTKTITEMAPTKSNDRILPITEEALPYFLRQFDLIARQKALTEAGGGVYYDNKLFIAKPDGSPQRRDRMSANFGQLIRHLEMPHIRFHDLRHTAATNMHQLTGDFYTVGEILGHTLKGIGISLGISTNLEAVTAQYVDVRLERKQSVLQTYHKALQPKTTVTGKEAGQETSKKAKKKSNEMEL